MQTHWRSNVQVHLFSGTIFVKKSAIFELFYNIFFLSSYLVIQEYPLMGVLVYISVQCFSTVFFIFVIFTNECSCIPKSNDYEMNLKQRTFEPNPIQL